MKLNILKGMPMQKIKIPAEVGSNIQVGSYNGQPIYSYQKICDIEAYEIRKEEGDEEKAECEE